MREKVIFHYFQTINTQKTIITDWHMQILKYVTKIPSRHYFKQHMRKIESCCVYGIEKWLVLFYPINCIVFLCHLATICSNLLNGWSRIWHPSPNIDTKVVNFEMFLHLKVLKLSSGTSTSTWFLQWVNSILHHLSHVSLNTHPDHKYIDPQLFS